MARPQQQPTYRPEDDPFIVAIKAGFVVAAFVFALPALVVAIPLSMVMEDQAWPRWRVFLLGALATSVAVLVGAWKLYLGTWYDIFRHLKLHRAPHIEHLLGLVPLGLCLGVAAAPVLQLFVHHHGHTEADRHRREQATKKRGAVRARRDVARVTWPEPEDRTVLGLRLAGDIGRWTLRSRGRSFVAPPLAVWGRQALVLGETGSGKTVSALRIAVEALRLGWSVYFIDGKADRHSARAFLQAAKDAGVDAVDGASRPIDGWRGGPDAVVNRLLATQDFSEPYYEGVARTLLRAAVGSDVPHSFAELLRRMDRRALVRLAEKDGYLLDLLKQIPDRELFGARARYEGIAWAVGESLDGSWSYEDVTAGYIPVGRRENRSQAEEIGAFLLEDLLHWTLARKDPNMRALVVVDEFSKLSHRPGAAVDLIERARSSQVGVVLIGQSWMSLGPDEATRSRLAGTVGTVIVHQLKQATDVAALGGTEWTLERTEQTSTDELTGLGSQRVGNRYVVHPDEVRRLQTGEAFLINGGQMIRLRVRPLSEGMTQGERI